MRITHLTASFMFGGPERQMLGLAQNSQNSHSFLSFSESGRSTRFVRQARDLNIPAKTLAHDTPYLLEARRDVIRELARSKADAIICHGYKSNLIGRKAARQLKIPALAVCRGWTGESPRIRLYELFDRCQLRKMDGVICVSQALARQVRAAGVPKSKIHVICNAVRPELFRQDRAASRERVMSLFRKIPADSFVIGSAGRLSREKGFDLLITAAVQVVSRYPRVRFALFGEGSERASLQRQIEKFKLEEFFFLAGFTEKLDQMIAGFDAFVSASTTEGLPNVLLESAAVGLPIVATAVGGVPEIVKDQQTGILVPSGNPNRLANSLGEVVEKPELAKKLGKNAREYVARHFSFAAQADEYDTYLSGFVPGQDHCVEERRRAA
ncbi:glycosyltransferase [Telmatocola sphagniphila]|uniref:Glycosyltransferase n=1 Tax=Telmatocola sphagniphila TaxID=1123043 RepID=A0A8E6EVQ7_9BACT|nr:glycosyltransferase [Telmatocola sphagniphila]QVL33085.1 glycosyltransferase [Telmatocola sphagniphila]